MSWLIKLTDTPRFSSAFQLAGYFISYPFLLFVYVFQFDATSALTPVTFSDIVFGIELLFFVLRDDVSSQPGEEGLLRLQSLEPQSLFGVFIIMALSYHKNKS